MRGLMVLALLLGGWFQPAWAMVNPTELGEAVTAIEQLDQMRVGLASTLEGRAQEPTLETFQQVCAPVGRRSKEIAQTHGWQVRQVALKYRNSKAETVTNVGQYDLRPLVGVLPLNQPLTLVLPLVEGERRIQVPGAVVLRQSRQL